MIFDYIKYFLDDFVFLFLLVIQFGLAVFVIFGLPLLWVWLSVNDND